MAQACPFVVVSMGCPAGIGPEVSVAGAAASGHACLLVGDVEALHAAAELTGVDLSSAPQLEDEEGIRAWRATGTKLALWQGSLPIRRQDRRPGKPSTRAGAAQLSYIESAYKIVEDNRGAALVTGPVSKAAIATSTQARAAGFRGHTEWLMKMDRAKYAIMCFATHGWSTSLVTTHLPHRRVARALSPEGVTRACTELVALLTMLGERRPKLAVASLNPHAGENELLGKEEQEAIVPGIAAARQSLGRRAVIEGPIGAETAYRHAQAGRYAGVVAMYHDQATIPTKLTAFGKAVNVTMGLSVPRTSVDHGTAYDIAWRGKADASGMCSAIELGSTLAKASQRHGVTR